MSVLTRLVNLFRRRALDRDLDDEVRFHLSERMASNVRRGMTEGEAEQSAYEQFGSVERAKRDMREVRMVNRVSIVTFAAGIVVGAVGGVWVARGAPGGLPGGEVSKANVQPATSAATPEERTVYTVGQDGVTSPVVIRKVNPLYTSDAMRNHISGTVVMSCVVQPDGVCDGMEITKSLDAGLDRQAMIAMREWRFRPGERNGRAVPVQVTIEMAFRTS